MKAKPQITSDQHKELMEQVTQLNILRESNSVLRDEKNRIFSDFENMKSRKNELEVEIQPLRRKEADLMIVIEKKENEKTEIRESINKIKACVLNRSKRQFICWKLFKFNEILERKEQNIKRNRFLLHFHLKTCQQKQFFVNKKACN